MPSPLTCATPLSHNTRFHSATSSSQTFTKSLIRPKGGGISKQSPPFRLVQNLPQLTRDTPPPLTSIFDTFASRRHTSLHIASHRHFSRHFATLSLHFVTLSLRFAPLALSIFAINPAAKLRFFNAALFATQRDTTHRHKPEHHATKPQHGPNMVLKWSKMEPNRGPK